MAIRAQKISKKAGERLDVIKARYPEQRSAILYALYLVQEEHGWITPEGIEWVAEQLNVTPAHVQEVATFYTMYYKRPVGRYHIQVCRTLSCALAGSKAVREYIEQRLGIGMGEVSADGLWSIEEVECLGSCGTAPVVQINDAYFEKLTVEKMAKIMDRIERDRPDLRLSTRRDALGPGLRGYPRSEVV